MTMARINDDQKVVEVGLPDSSMKNLTKKALHTLGWRDVKGTPRPSPNHEYMGPYTYDSNRDVVFGTWVKTNRRETFYQKRRESAVLTRAQFKLALLEKGYLADVKKMMENTTHTDPRVLIEWENSNEFRRTDNIVVSAIANELGYTEYQLDVIFGVVSDPEDDYK